MFWLAIALGTIVTVIVVALAIPVRLDLTAALTDRLRGHVRLWWLFTLVDAPLGGPPGKVTAGPAPAAPHEARPAAARKKPRPPLLAVLRTPGLIRQAERLLTGVLKQVHAAGFRLEAAYGLDDPADTGQLCGALAPALVLASVRGMNVQCTPVFTRAALEGSCRGSIIVRPLAVIGVVVAFLCSPPAWRAFRAWRRRS